MSRFLILSACWIEAESDGEASETVAAALRTVKGPSGKGAAVHLPPQPGLRAGLAQFDLDDVLDPQPTEGGE